ncbi:MULTISPECIES: hypothetical protein [unclassified Streptomyces]|uniref:hypothetical protein n=1 Tax=unclassified Streptomyces TaxID=2593676 RepID=UPI000DAC177A|nr:MULTISPECIES: hypothetical protein [unclassified Streptomyces]PZT75747.1 hypothetical protein DNK56_20140 [Streptomyces sp. AC1-42W]PZT80299.1 hypothetical protein DNK55_12545 [Streptomyces sp. AC1-42T]
MTWAAVTTGHLTAALELPPGLDTGPAVTAADRLPGGWSLTPPPANSAMDGPILTMSDTEPEPTVRVEGQTVHLTLPHQAAHTSTLAYVTYTALERSRQQRQMLTLHANAMVTPSGLGILLLGSKGAGKTSVVLALGSRGWTHAGDDLAVLAEAASGLLVLPGKPTAAVRSNDPVLWQAPKPVVTLAPFLRAPVPLVGIIRLTVHPAVPGPLVASATPFSPNEQLRLHEALARYISGLPTPLTGPAGAPYGPVWPLDDPSLARWRTHLITRLEQHPYNYLYAPDPRIAADLITKRYT